MKTSSFYTTLLRIDKMSEAVPCLSSLTSLVDLIQKSFFLRPQNCSEDKERYYEHVYKKTYGRAFLLLFPIIGNIAVALYDHAELLERKNQRREAISSLVDSGVFLDKEDLQEWKSRSRKVDTATLVKMAEWIKVSKRSSEEKRSLLTALLQVSTSKGREFFSLFCRLSPAQEESCLRLCFALFADELDNPGLREAFFLSLQGSESLPFVLYDYKKWEEIMRCFADSPNRPEYAERYRYFSRLLSKELQEDLPKIKNWNRFPKETRLSLIRLLICCKESGSSDTVLLALANKHLEGLSSAFGIEIVQA